MSAAVVTVVLAAVIVLVLAAYLIGVAVVLRSVSSRLEGVIQALAILQEGVEPVESIVESIVPGLAQLERSLTSPRVTPDADEG